MNVLGSSGCLAAICVTTLIGGTVVAVNLMDALNRSRHKVSLAGVRDWAATIDTAYDKQRGNAKPVSTTTDQLQDFARRHNLTLVDGWGHIGGG